MAYINCWSLYESLSKHMQIVSCSFSTLKNISVSALCYPTFSLYSHTFRRGFCILPLKYTIVLKSKLLSYLSYK
jgi:hypothetical protein